MKRSLEVIGRCSVDGMQSMGPSKNLQETATKSENPSCQRCLDVLVDLSFLMLCNSQPLKVVMAQNLAGRVLTAAFAKEVTIDMVAEKYEEFLSYLRKYQADYLNAKIQCKHFTTYDTAWLARDQVRLCLFCFFKFLYV